MVTAFLTHDFIEHAPMHLPLLSSMITSSSPPSNQTFFLQQLLVYNSVSFGPELYKRCVHIQTMYFPFHLHSSPIDVGSVSSSCYCLRECGCHGKNEMCHCMEYSTFPGREEGEREGGGGGGERWVLQ